MLFVLRKLFNKEPILAYVGNFEAKDEQAAAEGLGLELSEDYNCHVNKSGDHFLLEPARMLEAVVKAQPEPPAGQATDTIWCPICKKRISTKLEGHRRRMHTILR